LKTKVECIRERFEAKGWSTPPDKFTDEEVLNMAQNTYIGNWVLLGIAWEDFVFQLKQALPNWIKKLFLAFNNSLK
jgi:hypothetical protein